MTRSKSHRLTLLFLVLSLSAATGCRSFGKLKLPGAKAIPILTRQNDADLPAPSAAATPTNITGAPAPATAQAAGGTSYAAAIANSGDQTQGGIQYPQQPPTGDYPSTNYQTYPRQPEAMAPQVPGAVPSATNATRPPGNLFAGPSPATGQQPAAPDVQQGPYTARPSYAGPATAGSMSSEGGGWPTPLANQATSPTFGSSTNAGSAAGSNLPPRDSSFSGGPGMSAATPQTADRSFPSSSPVQTAQQNAPLASPAATASIDSYEPSPAASPTTGSAPAVTTTSHYEELATAPKPSGPWRPGSTTTLTR